MVIATDGGLMPAPQPVKRLLHGNAERYEVIIDFAKYKIGQRVVLRNISPKNNIDYTNTNKVMAFDVVAKASTTVRERDPHGAQPGQPVDGARRSDRRPRRGPWTWCARAASGPSTGRRGPTSRPVRYQMSLANPALNAVEIWEHPQRLRRLAPPAAHPPHRLPDPRPRVDRNGIRLARGRTSVGPKDVVHVGENERVRVIAQFGPHAGRYMIHCHNLVHEDHDMMGQFWVGSGGLGPGHHGAPCRPLPAPEL